MKWLLQIELVLSLRSPEPEVSWDISHCPSNINAGQYSKTIVSRNYPGTIGNDWFCEYSFVVYDLQAKIMVEFLDFNLHTCREQNLTIIDSKTKRSAGPYCQSKKPPMFLSDSNTLKIIAKSGTLDNIYASSGFRFKVSQATKEEFEELEEQNEINEGRLSGFSNERSFRPPMKPMKRKGQSCFYVEIGLR